MAHRPGRGHRQSTWTRRRKQLHTKIYLGQIEFMLHTGNRFVRELASDEAPSPAKEWVLRLCLPPGRDRRTHNTPQPSYIEHGDGVLICVSDSNPQVLTLQVRGDRCPDGRPKQQGAVSACSVPPRCLSVTHS
ncbi:BQ5605_C003g02317 [Microbotryum silenes-dioicae]|uniref:BQ5605_C003g02317 protein n=1 Tax=Microbotryum silenes-dioicae TaxID=796604 RepID=A0A2X0MNH1_9BASI|nr:BQ5605_C003g02317 [Microbotryum silenes-dioicae]